MANIPGNLQTLTREPLDGKYWIQDFSTIDSGLTFQGLLRFDKSTDKLWIKLSQGWVELQLVTGGTSSNTPFSFKIGTVQSGTTATVKNVGTDVSPILNFVIPKGDVGDAATIIINRIESSADQYAHIQNIGDNHNAEYIIQLPKGEQGIQGPSFTINAQGTLANRVAYDSQATGFVYLADTGFVYIKQSVGWSDAYAFKGPKGDLGNSLWIAYSASSNGSGASYTFNQIHKYISILPGATRPALSSFDTWVLFKGLDGGAAGASAYQTWLSLGNTGTETAFIDSLDGAAGLSAYQIWLSLGNVGSQQQFINSLKGDDSSLVHKTGAETIGGAKTFTNAVTAFQFIGDGSQLTGIPSAGTSQGYVDSADTILQNQVTTNTTNIGNNATALNTKISRVTISNQRVVDSNGNSYTDTLTLTDNNGLTNTAAISTDVTRSYIYSQVSPLTIALATKAPSDSPGFSGTPTVPTAVQSNSTTQIANTSFVTRAVYTLENTLQNQISLNTNRLLSGFIVRSPGIATAIYDAPTAFASTPDGTITIQQALVVYSSGTGSNNTGILGPIDGGTLNMNGGRIGTSARIMLNYGSCILNGILLSNGGVGSIATQAVGGGSGGVFGEILIKNMRIGTNLFCGDTVTTILDACTFFAGLNGNTIQYSGRLIIHANCDLGGRVPTAVAVAGKPAPTLVDYRSVVGTATTSLAGVVKIGTGISVATDGTISLTNGGGPSPTAYLTTGQANDGYMTQKATTDALGLKADLVTGLVSSVQLPIATSQQITAGSDNTTIISPYGLKQAGFAFGSDVYVDDWDPATNYPYLDYSLGINGKGKYYRIYRSVYTVVSTTTTAASVGYSAITVNDATGIYVGMRAKNPDGKYFIVYGINGNTIQLSEGVIVDTPAGSTFTFSVLLGGYTEFTAGDFLIWTGGKWSMRPGGSSMLRATASTAGIVKIGSGISITTDGTISVAASGVTQAYVDQQNALKANITSPALLGTPTTPTQVAGTNNTSIASTAFVQSSIAASTGVQNVVSVTTNSYILPRNAGDIFLSSVSNNVIGIYKDSVLSCLVGTFVILEQATAAYTVSIEPYVGTGGEGVIIRLNGGLTSGVTSGIGDRLYVQKTGPNLWDVYPSARVTSTTGVVTQSYVDNADTTLSNKILVNNASIASLTATKASLESPSLTGAPTVPTAPTTTINTQVANTQFVANYVTANPTPLPTATSSIKGGITIGSGLLMSGSALNNKAFDNGATYDITAVQTNGYLASNSRMILTLSRQFEIGLDFFTIVNDVILFYASLTPTAPIVLTAILGGTAKTIGGKLSFTMPPGSSLMLYLQTDGNLGVRQFTLNNLDTTASAATAGIVKIGSGINVATDGTISVVATTPISDYRVLTSIPTGAFVIPTTGTLPTVTEIGKTYILTGITDLGGTTLTLAKDTVLYFNGGQIINGTLVGTGSNIVATNINIFTSITLTGTWRVASFLPEWWGNATLSTYDWKVALQSALDAAAISGAEVKLGAFMYKYTGGLTVKAGVAIRGVGRGETVLGSGTGKGSVLFCSSNGGNTANVALKVLGSMVTIYDIFLKGLGNASDTSTGLQLYGIGVGIENCAFKNIIVHGFLGGIGMHLLAGNAGSVTYCDFNNIRFRNCKHHLKIESLSSNPIYNNLGSNGLAYTSSTGFLNSNNFYGFYSSGYADTCLWIRSEIDTAQVNSQDVSRPCNNLLFNSVIIESPYSSNSHIRIEGSGSSVRMRDIRVEASQQDAYYPLIPIIYLGPKTNSNLIDCDLTNIYLQDFGYNNTINSRSVKSSIPNPTSTNLWKNAALVGLTQSGTVWSLPEWVIEEQCVAATGSYFWRPLQLDSAITIAYDTDVMLDSYKAISFVIPPSYQIRITQGLDRVKYGLTHAKFNCYVKSTAFRDVTFTYQDSVTPILSSGASFGTGVYEPIGGLFPITSPTIATAYYRIALFSQNAAANSTNINFSFTRPVMVTGDVITSDAAKPLRDNGGTIYGVMGYNTVKNIQPVTNPLHRVTTAADILLPFDGNYFEINDTNFTIQKINYVTNRFPRGSIITLYFIQASVTISSSGLLQLTKEFISEAGSSITLQSVDGNGIWRELNRYSKRVKGYETVDFGVSTVGNESTVPVSGSNIYNITNPSATALNIQRLNNSARMDPGTVIILNFVTPAGTIVFTNSAYISLAKTGSYTPVDGDWIMLSTIGNGTWTELERKQSIFPVATKGVSTSDVVTTTVFNAGILGLSTLGENQFVLNNTSAAGANITRINDAAAVRFAGGTEITISFTTLTNIITFVNSTYISLIQTGNYTPLVGDWIRLTTDGSGVWKELSRKGPSNPTQTKGVGTIVLSAANPSALFLTLPKTGENFIRLSGATSGGQITRINNAAIDRLAAGTIVVLKFIDVTVAITITHSSYINLAGSVNFVPVVNSTLTLITVGDGTWEEISRRTT